MSTLLSLQNIHTGYGSREIVRGASLAVEGGEFCALRGLFGCGLSSLLRAACGLLPMLHALYNAVEHDGQLSFEERMGCGFGACMGCSCKTKYGYKRICKEGPVLTKDEIIW